ncbi:MAG: hypothetical protein M1838_004422 [Thelocarpon superellum]|nr:MAG: hypothetical protein M1838_004422 [Thelocarpon superellum]
MSACALPRSLGLWWVWIAPTLANLPYNPARAFNNPRAENLFYLFLPNATASSSDFQLLTLNASSTLAASNLQFETLSSSLPFLADGVSASFTPTVDEAGNISVYAGSCAPDGSTSSVWDFIPNGAGGDDGSWTQHPTRAGNPAAPHTLLGANYLASGVAFSTSGANETSRSTQYIFGGMCPLNGSSSGSWTSAADYSGSLLIVQPASASAAASSSHPSAYMVGTSPSKGPPIPEAGFSITPLLPSILQSSDGVPSEQQSFVLLGGHTQNAFINMSQVALLSLPEESWTFLSVGPTTESPETDLAVRTPSPNVTPRSGHTAVMTSDGKRVVVFGGWVGDTSTPADPQLAILELGDGYGGTGNWQWTVPSQSGLALPPGAGIFGHAAALLPGDVMMILGGYSIPSNHGSVSMRATPQQSSAVYFFNTTSSSWTPDYTNPSSVSNAANGPSSAPASDSSDSGPLSTPSKKAALGSGVALAVVLIVGAMVLWWWYRQRHDRRRREAREKELRGLSWTAQRFYEPDLGTGGMDGRGAEQSAMAWMAAHERSRSGVSNPGPSHGPGGPGGFGDGPGWKETGGAEAERTGLLVEIPSPTRGLRKSLHSRGRSGERLLSYQMGQTFDENRRSLAGSIHPIDERDEYEETAAKTDVDLFGDSQATEKPGSGDHTTMSSLVRERGQEMQEAQNWGGEWSGAEESTQSGTDRLSPERGGGEKERTSSTLSERSQPSTVSMISIPPSQGTVSRSVSQRSATLFSAAPYSYSTSPTRESTGGKATPRDQRSQSLTLHSRADSTERNSFNTAHTSFPLLQSEGETLLPRLAMTSPPVSPTRRVSRARGWMGSMKRAIPFRGSSVERSSSPEDDTRTSSSSPIKAHRSGEAGQGLPKRATSMSSSASYWQRKQGAADWDAATSTAGSAMEGTGSEEWDVEAAVERRVVQVMFTVPREKLRVVNGSEDGASSLQSEEDEDEDDDLADLGRAHDDADDYGPPRPDARSKAADMAARHYLSEL